MSNRSGKAHAMLSRFFLEQRKQFQRSNGELIPGTYSWTLPAAPNVSYMAEEIVLMVDIFERRESGYTDYVISFAKTKPYRRPLFDVRARHVTIEEELFVFNCSGHEYQVPHFPYQVAAHFSRNTAAAWPELHDLFRNEAGYM